MFSVFELSRFLGGKAGLYRFACGHLVHRLNTTDHVITRNGETFLPCRGIRHSSIRESRASAKKNEVTITIPYRLDPDAVDPPISQPLGNWWRPYPPPQRVFVDILTTHLGDPDEEVNVEWTGRVLAPSFKDIEISLTCDPSRSNSRTSGRAPRIQRNCGVALYSQGYMQCNLDPEPIAVLGIVTDVSDNDITLAFPFAAPRPVVGGPLEWLDGANELQATEIVAIDGNVFTLDDASALAVDDAVTVYTVPLWFEATLSADMAGLQLQAPEFATSPHGMAGGFILWTRADGLQDRRSVRAHLGDVVVVDYGATDLVAGTVVRAYWGCEHNEAACTARGNAIHYPGFKHLPVDDPMGRSQAW